VVDHAAIPAGSGGCADGGGGSSTAGLRSEPELSKERRKRAKLLRGGCCLHGLLMLLQMCPLVHGMPTQHFPVPEFIARGRLLRARRRGALLISAAVEASHSRFDWCGCADITDLETRLLGGEPLNAEQLSKVRRTKRAVRRHVT
jgi:hypothetical protein